MTLCISTQARHLRLEVVHALLVVAHFGGVGEELLDEKWSVEIRG